MSKYSVSLVYPDTPGKDPTTDDLLYYGPFAKNLANSIQKMFNPNGFVISINGDWGSGKTTILNFTKYYLEKLPKESQPIVIEFNPWWFSGRDDLIRQFFVHFGIGVSKNLTNAKEITKLIGQYLLTFSSTVMPNPVHSHIVKSYYDSIEFVETQFDPDKKSIRELKDEIKEKISAQGKILIIIDDIDRLNSEEISQLFQVIKTVADFPNVVFLLSFDKKIVTKILTEVQKIPGEEYLEKIIQAQFDIPCPEKEQINNVLLNKLELLFANYDHAFFKDQDWLDIFTNGISQLIETPRDINRFINTLDVTYSAVAGEVNPIDFLAIEAIRIFQPETYSIIRNNASAFMGYGTNYDRQKEYEKKFYEDYRDLSKKKSYAIDNISTRLFPKYCEKINKNYPHNWRKMRRDLRLCSPEIFPTYFWMTIPPHQFSKKEIQQFISLMSEPIEFKNKIMESINEEGYKAIRQVNYIFSRLTDHAENDIPLKDINSILPIFYEISDEILIYQDQLSLDAYRGNELKDDEFIREILLSRLKEPERNKLLLEIIQKSNTLNSITIDIRGFSEEGGNHTCNLGSQQNDQMLSTEHLKDLKIALMQKYETLSHSKALLKCPYLSYMLDSWILWAEDKEKCRNCVQLLCKDDMNFVKILEKFASVTIHADANGIWIEIEYNLKRIENFFGINGIEYRVITIKNNKNLFNELSGRQKSAIEHFLKAVETKKEKDKDENRFIID